LKRQPFPGDGFKSVRGRGFLGLSFGAFDHAFHELGNSYDFWHFLEDDHIVIGEGQFLADYRQVKELGEDVGFVASVGCSDLFAPHCHGGCGVSSRAVLAENKERNFSDLLGRHHLPFWNVVRDGAEDHNLHGEVPFTSGIAAMGLQLVNSRCEEFLVNWRARELRNCHGEAVRFVEWSEAMTMPEAPASGGLLKQAEVTSFFAYPPGGDGYRRTVPRKGPKEANPGAPKE